MRIRIARTGRWLATKATVAQAFHERIVGLLGRSDLPPGEALVFPKCRSIHTIGMRFAIDVIFLDDGGKVVAVEAACRPGRILAPVWQAHAVVEMCQGAATSAGLATGDQLEMIEDQAA